ncbi:hypothetical protein JCGZ_04051 [Jatropha curcas]|uniref:Uncharacterized protein n=2 Tax=Jatropha curcas TaxID=180498 RepID=A0A067KUT7_JATCU|nr:hypothetical protein JCGZ_04051 [Jatropha curcas]
MICPAQELNNQHLYLSNIDLFLQRSQNSKVYIYKSNTDSFDIKLLKEALRKVLVQFYPVAGRLGRDDKGRLQINCNGDGVLFIEAETDSTVEELGGDLMLNEQILQLIPSIDYSKTDILSSFPLLVLQVTKFRCGGLSLGTQWHHILSDGSGYILFAKAWCEIARGLLVSHPPFIDRTILRNQVTRKPKFQHFEYDKLPPVNNTDPTQNNTRTELFNITLEQLNALKSKVQEENSNNGYGKTKFSSYEILTAHIWRCTCKARGLSNDQATKLNIAVDGRSRLKPPLPSGYFGNALFLASSIALAGDIGSETLKETVERIRKAINRMDNEFLRSAMDYIDGVDDIMAIVRGPEFCRCPNLSIVSWMRLPFYSLDFGMGKPLCMRPPNPVEGKGYIVATPSNEIDGSWVLILCLEVHHMQFFKNLFYDELL